MIHASTLAILSPVSFAGKALVALPKVHAHTFTIPTVGLCHGRHVALRIAAASSATQFTFSDDGILRLARDTLLSLDCAGGTRGCKAGTKVNIHATVEHPEWSQRFVFASDGVLCPVDGGNPACKTLCLGVNATDSSLELVPRSDAARRVVFGGAIVDGALHAARTLEAALPPPVSPDSDARYFLLQSPALPFLGDGRKALVVEGGSAHAHTFTIPTVGLCHGRHLGLRVGLARDAAKFALDGAPKNFGLRLDNDRLLKLDCAGGLQVAKKGVPVNLHATVEHPEWVQRFVFGADGTIGPLNAGNKKCAGLCLGVESLKSRNIVLVPRSDARRRLVFGGGEAMAGFMEELAAEQAALLAAREAMRDDAISRCAVSTGLRTAMRRDGFAAFPGAISQDLVRAARKEINRELGASSGGADQFKAKTFAHHPAILDLVRRSSVSYILAELLGGTPEYYQSQITTGQLALRFPGDMCPGDTAKCSQEHFENVAKGWHIDGCASDYIPGITDHYGEIHNFSALVGCLLSNVEAPLSGELCVYPGSHEHLAKYLRAPGKIQELRKKGGDALPLALGAETLFDRGVKNCIGTAGTLFVANYSACNLFSLSPPYLLLLRTSIALFSHHTSSSLFLSLSLSLSP